MRKIKTCARCSSDFSSQSTSTETPTRPLNDAEIAVRRAEIEPDGEAWKARELATIKDEVIVSADA